MVFEFNIGGYPGPFFRLEVINDYLEIRHIISEDDMQQYSIPLAGNATWSEVLQFLPTRKWKAAYIDENILDGTGWELLIVTPGIRLQLHGSNAYPPGFKKFLRLLNLVSEKDGLKVY